MSKQLLLISDRPDDQAFAKAAADASGYPLVVASSLEQASLEIKKNSVLLILAAVDSDQELIKLEEVLKVLQAEGSYLLDANKMHIICQENFEQIGKRSYCGIFSHVVLRPTQDLEEAGRHYGRIIEATLKTREIQGVRGLFNQGVTRSIKLKKSTDKAKVIAEVEDYLKADTSFTSRMINTILTSVDELLMNAIFDSRVGKAGDQLHKKTPRTAEFELSASGGVESEIIYDGQYFAFTAVDHIGSLDRNKVFSHVLRDLKNTNYVVNDGVINAGLGLASSLHGGASLVFETTPGLATAVTVIFKQTQRYEDFRRQLKYISIQIQ